MFFSITKIADIRFPHQDKIGEWYFNHDNGWHCQGASWYKGYDHMFLDHGNYCRVSLVDDHLEIRHDRYRSFPLWWDETSQTLTNLTGQGRKIWADKIVDVSSQGIREQAIDLYGDIDHGEIAADNVLDILVKNFKKKTQALCQDLPHADLKLFVSGGIDTLILLAMIKSGSVDLEMLDSLHIEFDRFLDINLDDIKSQYWAYNQIHHWRKHCVLLSGACGDEFLMRGPSSLSLWAAWHDIDLEKMLKTKQGYHVGYFNREKNLKIFRAAWQDRYKLRDRYHTQQDLNRQILNFIVNDHQHWHLGNTLTWTPFKDLFLTKTMLRLEKQDMVDHILDATICKKLIERLHPAGLEILSHTKNYLSRQNLYRILDY